VLLQAFQIAGYRILDVFQSFVIGFTLGDAAGQTGNLRHKDPILVLFYDYAIFHTVIVTPFYKRELQYGSSRGYLK
jgi:hypothetical protein